MRNPKLPKDPTMVSEALAFVAVQAFVTVGKEPARGGNSTPSKGKKAKATDASKVLRPAHPALSARTREV